MIYYIQYHPEDSLTKKLNVKHKHIIIYKYIHPQNILFFQIHIFT